VSEEEEVAPVIDPEAEPVSEEAKGGAAKRGSGRRPDKPFVPFSRFEDIVVRCGHTEKFGLLPDGQDRFREGRRKKALGRDCKACREKRQKEETEAAERRRVEKEQRKAKQPPREKPAGGRLPDGSRFEMQYDATKQQWSGTLTVPAPEGAPASFSGSASALFRLLSSLDEKYRATLG
jgi:hypothetical protein